MSEPLKTHESKSVLTRRVASFGGVEVLDQQTLKLLSHHISVRLGQVMQQRNVPYCDQLEENLHAVLVVFELKSRAFFDETKERRQVMHP